MVELEERVGGLLTRRLHLLGICTLLQEQNRLNIFLRKISVPFNLRMIVRVDRERDDSTTTTKHPFCFSTNDDDDDDDP